MSTRSRPSSVTSSTSFSRYHHNGTIQDLGEQVLTNNWLDSVTYGENIQGWRQKLRDGLPATTSLSGQRMSARFHSGYLSAAGQQDPLAAGYYRNVVTGDMRLSPDTPSDPSEVSSSDPNSQALGRFNQRIFEVTHSFQGGVFLGELGQTIRMVKNPALGLRRLADNWLDLARSIRRQRIFPLSLRKKEVLENLADAWLEVQFGWRPLMRDIQDGNEALSKWNQPHGLRTQRVTASAEAKTDPSETTSISSWPGFWLTWYTRYNRWSHCKVVYRGAVRVEAKNPAQMRRELLGFDLASFAPTAWELIPYSFLIDYFSNVGDIITGWANLGVRVTWCNRTVIRSTNVRATSVDDPAITGWPAVVSYQHEPALYICERRDVSREAYGGSLVPDVDLEIPSLGSTRWLNIAALIASRDADRQWSFD